MMKNLVVALLGIVVLIGSSVEIYAFQKPMKAAVCVACHGATGVSVNGQWPNLAGQHASYLRKQLMDYKEGRTRRSAVMTSIISSLSNQEIDALAQYYASLKPESGRIIEKYVALGQKIYREGDVARGVNACIVCHGPKGVGNAEGGFPVVAGQHAEYMIQELLSFQDKARQNDLNQTMQTNSAHMTREEIEAVAYYMQGLH